MDEKDQLDKITLHIIGAAIEVHRAFGPGLLESAYEACLTFELVQVGLNVERQKPLPVIYKKVILDCGYRLDRLSRTRSWMKSRQLTRSRLFIKHNCFPICGS